MNIFELASREAYRFDSVKGALTVEDLWLLPLTTTRNNAASLDNIAKEINKQLKSSEEESFVTQRTSKDVTLASKLELVKHIIAVKMQEAEAVRSQAAKAEEKAKLLAILAKKQEESLENLTEEEILNKLNNL